MKNKKWVLMNPGPVNVSEGVRKALLCPDMCHREKEFSDTLSEIRKRLLKIFKISDTHTVAILTGSGTAALECMLSSFADEKKKVLVLSNGVYGERMKYILEVHGSPVDVLTAEEGGFPSLAQAESLLKGDRSIHAIAMVHHETSTGMLNPLKAVSALAKKYNKTFLVDAISSLGAETIDFSDIGFCAGAAGKCLHGFPGASFVIVSKKEAAKLSSKKPKSLYLDLWNTLKYEEKDDTPFTPAVQIFVAFNQALKELEKEGVSKRIKNYEIRSSFLEQGFIKLGLRFVVEKKSRSHVLTALWLPNHIRYTDLHRRLKKAGFIIYAGQNRFAGKIFRISNLGKMTLQDLKKFLNVLGKIIHRS